MYDMSGEEPAGEIVRSNQQQCRTDYIQCPPISGLIAKRVCHHESSFTYSSVVANNNTAQARVPSGCEVANGISPKSAGRASDKRRLWFSLVYPIQADPVFQHSPVKIADRGNTLYSD